MCRDISAGPEWNLTFAHEFFLAIRGRTASREIDLFGFGRSRTRVFFDRADLPAGDEYHNRIRAAIENSHLVIFLISPDAIDAESYTLTEVDIAVKARVKLLPVMFRDTDIAKLQPAVQAVTIYRPDGNVAASVAAEYSPHRWQFQAPTAQTT